MSSQYPKDEFDRAGEDMPVGMHRPQPSKWKSVIPFLAILVVVPLLGWGASILLTSRGNDSTSAESDSSPVISSQSSEAQGTASEVPQSEAASESATPSESASSTPEASESVSSSAVDYNVKISVLNGTGTTGYAASEAQKLNTAGFAGTSAANATGWASQSSAVYYSDPDTKSSAEEIARVLDIATVATADDSDLGSADIVVLLR